MLCFIQEVSCKTGDGAPKRKRDECIVYCFAQRSFSQLKNSINLIFVKMGFMQSRSYKAFVSICSLPDLRMPGVDLFCLWAICMSVTFGNVYSQAMGPLEQSKPLELMKPTKPTPLNTNNIFQLLVLLHFIQMETCRVPIIITILITIRITMLIIIVMLKRTHWILTTHLTLPREPMQTQEIHVNDNQMMFGADKFIEFA